MAGRYKPYSEYKDSGVEWLGDVPNFWSVNRLAYIFTQSNAGEVIDKNYWGGGEEILYTCNRTPLSSDYTGFPAVKRTGKNDLLLTRNGTPYVHKPVLNAIYSNVVQRISLNESFDRDYLALCLSNSATNLKGYGVSIESLNFENWKTLSFAYPDRENQRKIVEFLDHETAKIDTLIEKQQQLIQLLKEKRQAVISHAVTKGLNPNAKMKDSGVEWLGEVPEGWSVMQLRRITHLQQGLQIPQENRFSEAGENRVEYITVKSINAGDTAEHKEYIHSPSKRVVCEEEDILLARTGATGQVVTNVAGAFHNNFFKVNYDKNMVLRNYLVYFLTVTEVKSHLLMLAGTTTIPDLNHGAFLGTLICLPDFEEQQGICTYLDEALERYNYSGEKAQSFVNLLQERRTALISAAVTGKIDVRNWQAPLDSRLRGNDVNKDVAA